MSFKTRYWFFQSSRDNLVKFTRTNESHIFVNNVEGEIGVVGIHHTSWYIGDRRTHVDENQERHIAQLPLVTFVAQSDQQISYALSRHAKDLELFRHQHAFIGADNGILYVVLLDSERQDSKLSMTLAFGLTTDNLIPDFEGIELDTIFANEIPHPAPAIQPTKNRYERKWVI